MFNRPTQNLYKPKQKHISQNPIQKHTSQRLQRTKLARLYQAKLKVEAGIPVKRWSGLLFELYKYRLTI